MKERTESWEDGRWIGEKDGGRKSKEGQRGNGGGNE